jgi:hypothetical protein
MTTVDRRKRSHHYRVDDGLFPSAHLIVMHLSKQKFPLPEQFSAQRRGHLSARAALRLPSDDGLFPNAHIIVKHLSKQKFPLPEQFSDAQIDCNDASDDFIKEKPHSNIRSSSTDSMTRPYRRKYGVSASGHERQNSKGV